MNGLIGHERQRWLLLSIMTGPSWLSFQMTNDCFSIEKSIHNSLSNSATFGVLWLYLLLFRLILIKKNIPELFSHTWTAIWADASRLSPQSKFSEFIQLKWPFQFTEVTKIPSSSASVEIGYTSVHEYIFIHRSIHILHTHTHRICICVCVKILLGISVLMFLSSVSLQVMEILAKLRKWQAYLTFTQLISWSMILRGPGYLNTYSKTNE